MKTSLAIILFFFLLIWKPIAGAAQNAESQSEPFGKSGVGDSQQIALNLLQYPSSPALSVLGLEATEVPNSDEANDVGLTIRNNTKNFTTVPNTFALDIAPYWAFPRKKPIFATYGRINEHSGVQTQDEPALRRHHLWHDTRISFGYIYTDQKTRLGFGVKIPLIKGKIDTLYTSAFRAVYNYIIRRPFETLLSKQIKEIRDSQQALLAKPINQNNERFKIILDSTNALVAEIKSGYYKNLYRLLRPAIDSILADAYNNYKLYSVGFNLDAGSGVAVDFPNLDIGYMKIPRWSAWVNAAYFKNRNLSFLGVARYSILPEELYADPSDNTKFKTARNNKLDLGLKVQYFNFSNFSASFELLGRWTLNNPDIKRTVRYTVNMNYAIAKTHQLTFSFGKDFDNQISTDGNVVALLHFLFGFGSQRPVKVKTY